MYSIYKNGDFSISGDGESINFANQEATDLFKEGLSYFQQNDLANNAIIESGKSCYIFTWSGDKVANTLTTLLINSKLYAGDYHGVIEVPDCTKDELEKCLLRINNSIIPTPIELTEYVIEMCTEKYDSYLPNELLAKSYSAKMFDVEGAKNWISSYLERKR